MVETGKNPAADVVCPSGSADRYAQTPEAARFPAFILDSITDGFVALDREWRYVYVNQEAERLLQTPRSRLIGQIAWQVFPDLRGTEIEKMLRQAIETQTKCEIEEFFAPLNVWFAVRAYPSEEGLSIYFLDVSERRRAEQEREQLLRQAEANFTQLEAVVNTMSEGLIIADAQGNLLRFNAAALAMHGFDSLEQVQRHFSQFDSLFAVYDAAGNFVPLADWALSRVLRGDRYSDLELTLRRTDTGKTFVGSYSGAPVYDAGGQMTLAILTVRDITAQRQAQIELAQSQQRLQSTLDAIPHAVWVLSGDQEHYFSNQQWFNYYGVSYEAAMAAGWKWVPPDDLKQTQQQWEIARADRVPYEVEFRWHNEDGSERWYLCRAVPILDQAGEIIEWIGSNTDITRLKQIEAELQERQQFIQRVAEMLPGLLYVYDLIEQRNIYVNRESAELLGYTPEQIQAMGSNMIPTLVHPDDLPRMVASQEKLRTNQAEVVELEYRMRHASGDWCWILDRGIVFNRTSDGRARQVLGFAIDISARKQVEEERQQAEVALRQSEVRLRRIIDAELVGILFWHIDGAVTDANDVLLNLIGYSRAELEAGQIRWTDLTPSGWETVDTFALQELADRGACTPYEKEYFHKNGERIPILIGFSSLQDTPDAGVAFIVDVRDRKQTEIALRQSEERLKRALEAARMVAWEWTAENDRVVYSHTAIDLLGIVEVDQIRDGAGGLSLIHPDDVAGHQQVVAAAFGKGGTYVSPFRLVRADTGEIVWVEDRGTVYSDPDGNPTKITGMVMDISERVRLEQERDRILQQEQAARRTAEQANRIKDEFLAVLSHELRTPLNPILGWTKLLRGGKLDPAKTQHALATIERNAELQTQLIEDLLDVSKILQGKLTLEAAPVSPAAIVSAALETVKLAAEAKAIQIETHLDAIEGKVWGDAARLQQVVWNLLSNAVKFTPNGGRVVVRLEVGEDEGMRRWGDGEMRRWGDGEMGSGKESESNPAQPNAIASPPHPLTPSPPHPFTPAQIIITDTGKGIHPDFLPFVFEHFRQEDGATTRRFGGLGLGLAIARQLVELHGGTIAADSPGEGQGATFTVTLPLLNQNEDSQTENRSTHPPIYPSTHPPLHPLSGLTILVADDEADSREFVQFVLEQDGAQVKTVASGQEVLDCLAALAPDLLLSDIGMPDLDGYMLLQQIRSRSPEQGGTVPAIALTAYARELDQQKAIAAGFQTHLTKPIEPETLIRAIVELVPERSA